MAYYEGTVALRHCTLYMDENRASTPAHIKFSTQNFRQTFSTANDIQSRYMLCACVRLEDGAHYIACTCSLGSGALCSLLTFLVCKAAACRRRITTPTHQRTFSLTNACERSSLPRRSHVSLTQAGTNGTILTLDARRFTLKPSLLVIVLCQGWMFEVFATCKISSLIFLINVLSVICTNILAVTFSHRVSMILSLSCR